MNISEFKTWHSPLRAHVFRLEPGDDLKLCLLHFARTNKIQGAVILTCVGSLRQYNLRFANQKDGKKATGHFEILSLAGTLSETSVHLHLCIADHNGITIGGHLLDDNLVYTTAEIAIAELPELMFDRALDTSSGFRELDIRHAPGGSRDIKE